MDDDRRLVLMATKQGKRKKNKWRSHRQRSESAKNWGTAWQLVGTSSIRWDLVECRKRGEKQIHGFLKKTGVSVSARSGKIEAANEVLSI